MPESAMAQRASGPRRGDTSRRSPRGGYDPSRCRRRRGPGSRTVSVASSGAKCQRSGRELFHESRWTPVPSRCGSVALHGPMRMSELVPAHAPRRPGRRRGRQPPPARPGRLHPPGGERASTPGCRSATGSCATVEQIVREEMDARRRPGAVLPIVQPLELWERSGRDAGVRAADVPARGPQGDRRSASRPRPRRSSRRSSRASTRATATCPVNLYQINWKYRDELRPRFGAAARPRVPHEGRVLLRPPTSTGCSARYRRDVRRVRDASSRAAGSRSGRSRRRRARSAAT